VAAAVVSRAALVGFWITGGVVAAVTVTAGTAVAGGLRGVDWCTARWEIRVAEGMGDVVGAEGAFSAAYPRERKVVSSWVAFNGHAVG